MAKNEDVIEVALQAACIRAAAIMHAYREVKDFEVFRDIDIDARNLYMLATETPWKRGDE